MKLTDGAVNCETPADCQGSLLHHSPGASDQDADDVTWTFQDQGFFDRGLAIDSATGSCVAMENTKLPVDDNYMMQSKGCADTAPFVCARPCQGVLTNAHFFSLHY